jgi:hypothetical protein
MTMTPPHPTGTPMRCACGHLQGDHQSNHAPFPHPLHFGICLITGCRCRTFTRSDTA